MKQLTKAQRDALAAIAVTGWNLKGTRKGTMFAIIDLRELCRSGMRYRVHPVGWALAKLDAHPLVRLHAALRAEGLDLNESMHGKIPTWRVRLGDNASLVVRASRDGRSLWIEGSASWYPRAHDADTLAAVMRAAVACGMRTSEARGDWFYWRK